LERHGVKRIDPKGERFDHNFHQAIFEAERPGAPAGSVIEVPARIDPLGATALSTAPVEPLFAGLIAHVSGYEELALDAALRGGRARVVAALLAHPLIGQADAAERLGDRLIAENHTYLPWAAGIECR